MSTSNHCEIERKYLIRYPDTEKLAAWPGGETWEITQTYLTDGEGGQTRRLRQVVVDGKTLYYKTFKRRISVLTALEDESEISRGEYERLIADRDHTLLPVLKIRYRVPYEGHTLEFDIYPFWRDRAIMEVELQSEDEEAQIPDDVIIIRDVSGEKAYKNRHLARRVPMEPI